MKKPFIKRICAGLLSMAIAAGALNGTYPLNAQAADDFEDEFFVEEDYEETEDFYFEDEEIDDFTEESDDSEDPLIEDEIKEETESEEDTFEEDETELELPDQSGYRENSFRYQNGQRIQNETLFYSESGDYENEWTWDGVGWLNSIGEYIPGAKQKGIDVSYAQGSIDWSKIKNSDVSWAIIRCGYGDNLSSQDDAQWERNTAACETYGIPYGVYIYSYATSVAEAQSEAEHVLRLVQGKNLSMPIYYDLEDEATTGKCSNAEIAEFAKTFCNIIQSNGYDVGIYASKSWFTYTLTDSCFDSWPKWVAQYYTECTYEGSYDIWQCTGMGYVDGITNAVDLNFSYYNVDGGKEPTVTDPDTEDPVEIFVKRLYSVVLGRDADSTGLNSWTNKLKNNEISGAEIARQFFNSTEYLNRNTSDEVYLTNLYKTFFDRSPDTSGLKYWLNQLQSGQSRDYVLKGFAESNEFTKICTQYGIERGTITLSEDSEKTVQIQSFIKRNYTQFLGRNADTNGLKYWTNKLVSGQMTPAEVAKGFVFSNEFKNKNYTNEQFILKMYLGLFGRDADAKGFTSWRKKMSSGMTREEVFDGFVVSNEFKSMVAQFGL